MKLLLSAGFEKANYKPETSIQVLEDLVGELISSGKSKNKTDTILLSIETYIRGRFGIEVKIGLEEMTGIYLSDSFTSIFINKHPKQKRQKLMYKVDLDKKFIKDLDSKWHSYLILARNYVFDGLTKRELTAVILHEIGHAFYLYAYAYKSVRTNSYLLDSLKAFSKGHDKKAREYLVKITKELEDSSDASLIKGVISAIVEDNRELHQLGHRRNSEHEFERLADEFASDFGYGKDLATALNRLHIVPPTLVYFNIFLDTYITVLSVMWSGLAVSMGNILLVGLLARLLTVLIKTVFDFAGVATYENFYERLKSIKLYNIRILRDNKLDSEIKKSIIDTIKNIDLLLEKNEESRNILFKTLHSKNQSDNTALSFNKDYNTTKLTQSLDSTDLIYLKEELIVAHEEEVEKIVVHGTNYYPGTHSTLDLLLSSMSSKRLKEFSKLTLKYGFEIDWMKNEKSFYIKNDRPFTIRTGVTTLSLSPSNLTVKEKGKSKIVYITIDDNKTKWQLANPFYNVYGIDSYPVNKFKNIYIMETDLLSSPTPKQSSIIDTLYLTLVGLEKAKAFVPLKERITDLINTVEKKGLYLPPEVMKQFKLLTELDFGDVSRNELDIHGGNWGKNKNGKLVLLDPIINFDNLGTHQNNFVDLKGTVSKQD